MLKLTFFLISLSLSLFAKDYADSGRLLLSSGVSQVEGSSGGGLTPWATIAGYGTRDSLGASFFSTEARVQDYTVRADGIALGFFNRVELSYSKQVFNTLKVGDDLGVGHNFKIEQRVLGVKVRLIGDLILDQDTWMPQISIGAQQKTNQEEATVKSFGAEEAKDTDFYISFTKLYLAQRFLYNITIRRTRANQLGFLGYGGDENDDYEFMPELSLAYLVNRQLVVGIEYRDKPNNLDVADEDSWSDIFVAWTPSKNISLTMAYLDAGNIVTKDNQSGIYTSLQLGL
jgi:hypothetical protein